MKKNQFSRSYGFFLQNKIPVSVQYTLSSTNEAHTSKIITVEPLFEALSYCASLHPSITEEEDEGGGHPFSGVGPFGTGLLGNQEQQVESDGAFDDAEEAGDVRLSENGRVRNDFQTPDARFRPY